MGRKKQHSQYVLYAEEGGYWVGEPDNWEKSETGGGPDLSVADMMDDNPLLGGLLPGTRGKEARYDDAVLEARNRNHLWAMLREISKEYREITGFPVHGQELDIWTTCGEVLTFTAFDDLPLESLMCPCTLEYVIKYTAPWTKDIPR